MCSSYAVDWNRHPALAHRGGGKLCKCVRRMLVPIRVRRSATQRRTILKRGSEIVHTMNLIALDRQLMACESLAESLSK